MTATVLRAFVCRLTGRRYSPGDLYTGEPERIEILAREGFVEPHEPEPDEAEGEGCPSTPEPSATE